MVKKQRDSFEYMQNIVIGMLGIAFLGYVALQFFYIYNPQMRPPVKNNTVTFVTGITNSEDPSTLVSLHFECIKYCQTHVADSYMQDCWNECSKLGKEGCEK
jgi:hypothetical protein